MLFKLAVGIEVAVAGALASSSVVDGPAERVTLYAASLAGVLWIWKNVLRPLARVLHRTVDAVESLEELPQWRAETDERIAHLEDVAIRIDNGQHAIIRELAIEDKVRRNYPRPEDFLGPS